MSDIGNKRVKRYLSFVDPDFTATPTGQVRLDGGSLENVKFMIMSSGISDSLTIDGASGPAIKALPNTNNWYSNYIWYKGKVYYIPDELYTGMNITVYAGTAEEDEYGSEYIFSSQQYFAGANIDLLNSDYNGDDDAIFYLPLDDIYSDFKKDVLIVAGGSRVVGFEAASYLRSYNQDVPEDPDEKKALEVIIDGPVGYSPKDGFNNANLRFVVYSNNIISEENKRIYRFPEQKALFTPEEVSNMYWLEEYRPTTTCVGLRSNGAQLQTISDAADILSGTTKCCWAMGVKILEAKLDGGRVYTDPYTHQHCLGSFDEIVFNNFASDAGGPNPIIIGAYTSDDGTVLPHNIVIAKGKCKFDETLTTDTVRKIYPTTPAMRNFRGYFKNLVYSDGNFMVSDQYSQKIRLVANIGDTYAQSVDPILGIPIAELEACYGQRRATAFYDADSGKPTIAFANSVLKDTHYATASGAGFYGIVPIYPDKKNVLLASQNSAEPTLAIKNLSDYGYEAFDLNLKRAIFMNGELYAVPDYPNDPESHWAITDEDGNIVTASWHAENGGNPNDDPNKPPKEDTKVKIEWDKTGERFYETGVDHGVLYTQKSDGTYNSGVPWNGLTAVTSRPGGAEPTDLWADNIKYASLRSAESYEATIEAYTYPEEFASCDGSIEVAAGVYIGQQNRNPFGFTYRTKKGNDTASEDDDSTIIHVIYNATASPSEKAYNTINDSPDAITFSWEITTTPVNVAGHKPIVTVDIDTAKLAKADPAALTALEETLYGTDTKEPTLPSPDELIKLIKDAITPTGP